MLLRSQPNFIEYEVSDEYSNQHGTRSILLATTSRARKCVIAVCSVARRCTTFSGSLLGQLFLHASLAKQPITLLDLLALNLTSNNPLATSFYDIGGSYIAALNVLVDFLWSRSCDLNLERKKLEWWERHVEWVLDNSAKHHFWWKIFPMSPSILQDQDDALFERKQAPTGLLVTHRHLWCSGDAKGDFDDLVL